MAANWHNENHIQFKLSGAQRESLDRDKPPGMSVNQYAKLRLLQDLDPQDAMVMLERAASGKKRLTEDRG